MRDFEGYRFIALSAMLGEFSVLHPHNDVVIPEEWKEANYDALEQFLPLLDNLGMDASHASLARLLNLIRQPGVKFTDLGHISFELKGRLQDQAQSRQIFGLSSREASYATHPRQGWDTAVDRFPEIVQDVDEASYCLALSRYPASVYHSVQITEFGLMALGKFLKVNDPHSGWTAVANALEKAVKKPYGERTSFERKNFASLEQIHGTVQALKNAWRNKISHVQGRLVLLRTDFGYERTEEILTATRAFMRRLAEDIPAARRRKPKLSEIESDEVAPSNPWDELLEAAKPEPPQPRRSRKRNAAG